MYVLNTMPWWSPSEFFCGKESTLSLFSLYILFFAFYAQLLYFLGCVCSDYLPTFAKKVWVLPAPLPIPHLALVCPSETYSEQAFPWDACYSWVFHPFWKMCSGEMLYGTYSKFPVSVAFWWPGDIRELAKLTLEHCKQMFFLYRSFRIKCSVKPGETPVFFSYNLQKLGLHQWIICASSWGYKSIPVSMFLCTP